MMKKIFYFFMLICLYTFASCGQGKVDSGYILDGDSISDAPDPITVNAVRTQINELGSKRWDSNNYKRLNSSINGLSVSANAKNGLTDTLNYVYKGVVIKEINTIMDNECGSNHNRLNSAVDELKSCVSPGWKSEESNVLSAYNKHQEILHFVTKEMTKRQTPRSLSDRYDTGFESTIRKKAGEYLSNGVKCTYLMSQLKNPNFSARRNYFCEKLVEIYCSGNHSPRERSLIKSTIKSLCGSIDNEWEENINSHTTER